MEIKSDGRKWVERFQEVNEFYINVSRMLLCADDVMYRKSFEPYGYNWHAFYPWEHTLTEYQECSMWLPEFMIRQYYPEGKKDKEVFTIGTFLHSINATDFSQPLCIVSRLLTNTESIPDEVYLIAMFQGYQKDPQPDGKVHIIGENLKDITCNKTKHANPLEKFKSIVKGERFLSIALPLLEITNLEQLEKRLITPLLEDTRWPLSK